VSKRFVKSLDTAARIGNVLGANVKEEVVHAVDDVDLAVAPGESGRASSASRDAASRRSAGSRSDCCRCRRRAVLPRRIARAA
jgi:hypothetical protein